MFIYIMYKIVPLRKRDPLMVCRIQVRRMQKSGLDKLRSQGLGFRISRMKGISYGAVGHVHRSS